MNNIKMLYYGITDVSERIEVNKTGELKECDICHYWCFLNALSFNQMSGMCVMIY